MPPWKSETPVQRIAKSPSKRLRDAAPRVEGSTKQAKQTTVVEIYKPPAVNERVSPWGEIWHADMAPVFPFGETIFSSTIKSLEIEYDLSQEPDPSKRNKRVTLEKWMQKQFGGSPKCDEYRLISAVSHFTLPRPDADAAINRKRMEADGCFRLPFDRITDPEIELLSPSLIGSGARSARFGASTLATISLSTRSTTPVHGLAEDLSLVSMSRPSAIVPRAGKMIRARRTEGRPDAFSKDHTVVEEGPGASQPPDPRPAGKAVAAAKEGKRAATAKATKSKLTNSKAATKTAETGHVATKKRGAEEECVQKSGRASKAARKDVSDGTTPRTAGRVTRSQPSRLN